MKRYLGAFCFSVVCESAIAYTYYSGGEYTGVSSFPYDDIVVQSGATVRAPSGHDIKINNMSVELDNSGDIYGRIDTNGNTLFVYNTGVIHDGITTENGGSVTQIVRNNSELTNIGVSGGNYNLRLDNFSNVDFDDIKNINTTSVNINKSSVVINDFSDWQNWSNDVSFSGNVSLYINNFNASDDGALLRHVSGSDNVSIEIDGLDSLHKAKLVRTSGGVYLNLVRETNYEKVFADNRGKMLESIRANNPNDKMIVAMDSANNFAEINAVMNSSYRFNRAWLLKPIKIINNFMSLNVFDDVYGSGFDFSLFYIMSDEIGVYGAKLGFCQNYMDTYFRVGLNINQFDYSDNYNDYSGSSYLLFAGLRRYFSAFWADAQLGIAITKYSADNIYVNGDIINDPVGNSWYGGINAGYDFYLADDLKFAPIVGLFAQESKVLDYTESDFDLRVGPELKYSFVVDSLQYEYSASAMLTTDMNIFAGIKAGFMSVTDGAGAHIAVDMFKDEEVFNYKFSIGAKVLF